MYVAQTVTNSVLFLSTSVPSCCRLVATFLGASVGESWNSSLVDSDDFLLAFSDRFQPWHRDDQNAIRTQVADHFLHHPILWKKIATLELARDEPVRVLFLQNREYYVKIKKFAQKLMAQLLIISDYPPLHASPRRRRSCPPWSLALLRV